MNRLNTLLITVLVFSFSVTWCVRKKKRMCNVTAHEGAFNAARKEIEKAIVEGDTTTAQQLLNVHGSRLANAYHSHEGLAAFTLAAYANGRNQPAILRLLLETRTRPAGLPGENLLQKTLQYGYAQCLHVILDHGYEAPDLSSVLLHMNSVYAAKIAPPPYTGYRLEIARILLDKGADRTKKDGTGRTAIEILDQQTHECANQLKKFLLTYNPKKKIA